MTCARALLIAACWIGAAHGATIHYVYDDLGRLIAEIDESGATTRYTYDPAGNLLSVTRDSSTAFRVDGFTPASGKAGDAVTIFGAGFIPTPAQNNVSFNGTPASVTLATAHSLVAAVPSGATSGPITVSNTNGSATTAQAFTIIGPPVITATVPPNASRGQTTRLAITGAHLDSATAVAFTQPGFSIQIVSREPARLTIDLTVAGSVPFGVYGFSVTNAAGTSQSGAVTVTISAAVLGPSFTLTRPFSVHVPALIPGAPPGNAMSVTRRSLSVHLPEAIPGAPAGNAMGVTRPLSVHLPAATPGAPPGNAMNVTPPLSVSMP